ncbi:MAG: acetyl-CoA carboxylase carboxyltransferase subunit beta [Candidatus Marinimicrobia bacterium]|nr:acetyl-CoA carboxylase carboxyltransferase subunit beta [Candidatus Neomarinimicrobiota bacterium]
MDWFRRKIEKIHPVQKKAIPDGLWIKCPTCSEILYKPELERLLSTCRKCGHHFRISPDIYVKLILDEGSAETLFTDLKSNDMLHFRAIKRYSAQLNTAIKKSGNQDAIQFYSGDIEGNPIVLGVMNFAFIGGSMGSVVGEKIVRGISLAEERSCPLIIICASGGARMQEGSYSLMQMAKTSARLARFSGKQGLFISVLTDPTTGGVTASFAMLGDVILAEPGALVGFAGQRVIKQTIGQDLPPGFQRAEFLLEKGFIDNIVTRSTMKSTLLKIILILHAK